MQTAIEERITHDLFYRYHVPGHEVRQDEKQGPGRWAWVEATSERRAMWAYRPPRRPWMPAPHSIKADPNVRPEPMQPREKWERARCRCGPHTCGACGLPHWIELHGVSDGFCTACYSAG